VEGVYGEECACGECVRDNRRCPEEIEYIYFTYMETTSAKLVWAEKRIRARLYPDRLGAIRFG